MIRLVSVRVTSPVLLVLVAAAFWFSDVQESSQYLLRNFLPLLVVLALSLLTVWRGQGSWTGSGWRLPLGTLGFAIPAVGLSLYLHYAYTVNLNDMFTGVRKPDAAIPLPAFLYKLCRDCRLCHWLDRWPQLVMYAICQWQRVC